MNNQMLEKWLSGFNFYRRRVNIWRGTYASHGDVQRERERQTCGDKQKKEKHVALSTLSSGGS